MSADLNQSAFGDVQQIIPHVHPKEIRLALKQKH